MSLVRKWGCQPNGAPYRTPHTAHKSWVQSRDYANRAVMWLGAGWSGVRNPVEARDSSPNRPDGLWCPPSGTGSSSARRKAPRVRSCNSRLLAIRLLTSGTMPCVHGVATGSCRACVSLLGPSTRKVLRPATSTKVFLGFPVSISKCWDSSQDAKLPLHASHVALQT